MPFENIVVKITKTGEIQIRIERAEPQRLRDFRAFLEESLGPVSLVKRIEPPVWEREASIADEAKNSLEQGRGEG